MGMRDLIPTSGNFQDPENKYALWDKLKATAYERIISSQHDFVRFMQSMHVPDDVILFPPEGGWPEINEESFASMGKSKEAIKVLRNMAYIEGPMSGAPREILDETALADYRQPSVLKTITAGNAKDVLFFTEPVDEPAPPDFIGLTRGGRECRMIFLDCQYGIVRWPNCEDGITTLGPQTWGDRVEGGNELWGGDTAWPVEEFFEYIKAKFVSLEQLAFNRARVIKKDLTSSNPVYDFDLFKEMYQRHGWPGADYNKDACMKEMTDYCKENRIN